jgi:PAS domain S-box-containing protein
VDPPGPVARIVVVQPRLGAPGVSGSRSSAASGSEGVPPRSDTVAALARLGCEVELTVLEGADVCLDFVADQPIDLVIIDGVARSHSDQILESLRGAGPPVVFVSRGDGEEAVLEAFRGGAAECVRVGPDYADVLPAVALEQLERWRGDRERGAAERRIRDLESLSEAVVTEIPAGLLVLDESQCIVTANPEFLRSFGFTSSEVRGLSYRQVLPSDLLQSGEFEKLLFEMAAGQTVSPRVARMRGRDGEPRAFDVRGRRLDEQGRVLLVLSDVGERELLMQRVAELQRYNESIIQNMNSALLVVDGEGRVTFANPTAEEILGAESGRLVGRLVWDWFDTTDRPGSLIARTLERGVRFKSAETVITRNDGSIVPIGISCAPMREPGSQSIGAVAIFRDLSEIKQLQSQVLQTEKMASIGQLAAGIAHEINNPMGFIHANLFQMAEYLTDLRRVWETVDELQEELIRGRFERAQQVSEALASISREIDLEFVKSDFVKAVRESQEGSERIRHIVQDLRNFSRQDTAERVLADVNQCVDSTANIVWTMMKHSVRFEKEYDDLPKVRCYPMQLKQVFMNLLVNAYQAILERVGDSGEFGEIRIRTERVRDGVRVSIRDTGTGISPENLGRIFDPFFTTKQVGAGTGLGLSTSYSIVGRHGGTIEVESKLGEGSRFEVWLPREAPKEPVCEC